MTGSRRSAKNYFSLLSLLGGMLSAETIAMNTERSYRNPVLGQEAGADPAVILHGDTYYLYSTNSERAVYTSRDLVNWEQGPSVLPETFKGMWAPEVYAHPEDGKFYLYYTLKYKIGVAVADRPEGPFEDKGFLLLNGIDAHLFRDDDGRLYLYFTHTRPFDMYVVPMKSPLETGGPVVRCFQVSQDWERHSFALNEGPWMEKRDGKYTMLYSGSNGQSTFYAVGLAFAPTPIGPFKKFEENPVFQDLGRIHGPGHGSVIRDRAGQLWHVYHQKISEEIGWPREICIDPLAYDDQGVLRGKPTRGELRPAPICDPDLVWSPDISPRGAVFQEEVEVRLSCRTPDAEIRYTLDGSEPGPDSPLYQKAIRLTQSTQVRARAFRKGMRDSFIADMKFTRTEQPLPENPAPHAEAGETPFELFPKPILDWRPHVRPTPIPQPE